jgi:PII-like signaling protein/CBS domain-containing protein
MAEHVGIQRVRIYVNEQDIYLGQPLYLAILEELGQEGATGATAIRGIAGFGPAQRQRSAGTAGMTRAQPIIIDWIDRAERVRSILPVLEPMVPNALITIEDVQLYRSMVTVTGPFGEYTVRDFMQTEFITLPEQIMGSEALQHLIESHQTLVPVLNEQNLPVAILSKPDLFRRLNYVWKDSYNPLISVPQQQRLLASLANLAFPQLYSEWRSVYAEASIAHAVGMMIEFGTDALPVVDRSGEVIGLFTLQHALQAAYNTYKENPSKVNQQPLYLSMQSNLSTLPVQIDLTDMVQRLLRNPMHYAVLVEDFFPRAYFDEHTILQGLPTELREEFLTALSQNSIHSPELVAAFNELKLAYQKPSTIISSASELEAIVLMIDQDLTSLLVVSDDGRLAGLVTRQGLIRSLLQASTPA